MIHEWIRKERISQGIKQEDIAKEIFVTVQAYNQYEKGKRELRVQTLERIIYVLGYNLEFIKSEHYKKFSDEFYRLKEMKELEELSKDELIEYLMHNTSVQTQHDFVFSGKTQELFYMLSFEQRYALVKQTIQRMTHNYVKYVFLPKKMYPKLKRKWDEKMKFESDLRDSECIELQQLANIVEKEVNKMEEVLWIRNNKELTKAFELLKLWIHQVEGLRLYKVQPGNIIIEFVKDGMAYDEYHAPFDYFGMDIEEKYYEEWEKEWLEMNENE